MPTTAVHAEITSTVAGLSDDELLSQTGKLARLEQQVQVFVIDHLREVDARGLYLQRGFGTIFEYAVRELGYSDAAAWRRMKAMELCEETAGARDLLQDGLISLSTTTQKAANPNRAAPASAKPSAPSEHATSTSKARSPASRAIPAAVKRQVWLRDGGRCRFVDGQTGRRCLPAPASDRPYPPVRAGRRRRDGEPETIVRSSFSQKA